jgi:hypothetical protein
MQYLARSAVAAATAMTSTLNYAQPVHIEVSNSDDSIAEKEEDKMISRPKLPIEFAHNFKYIFDHNLLLSDDFFSNENLKNIFNLNTVKVNQGDKNTLVLSDDFSGVFPRTAMPEAFGGPVPSASLVVYKAIDSSGSVSASLNFGMKAGGPNFQGTEQIFGDKFIRLYQMPSPHGGPSPATAAHGNENWKYELTDGGVAKAIIIGFNPGGELSNVRIEFKTN